MAANDPYEKRTNREWDDFCDRAFGPEGTVTKEFAAREGDALFAAFLAAFDAATKVPSKDAAVNNARERVRRDALAKRYHDYEGDLMKIGLVDHLQEAGLPELARAVMHGDYDF